MVGNGNSNKSENDKGKKAMLAIGFHPTKSLMFEVYGDWFAKEGYTDWTTWQLFAAYKIKEFRLGL